MLKEWWRTREDAAAWLVSMLGMLAIIGLMYGIGAARGWDATSPFTHNISATSSERFLPEPLVPEPGVRGRYGPDAAARWYYWKLSPDLAAQLQTNWVTQNLQWIGYVLHLVAMWLCIYWAQKVRDWAPSGTPAYSAKLRTYNLAMLAVTFFFHFVHLAQTHWTYDGLARDVSVNSSQGSVIAILIFILIIEFPDRGFAFGWPRKPARAANWPVAAIRKYHGYGFAWGAIFTFWYHPMENTAGHALGFLHTFMLMLQGSLVYTDWHRNEYWRLLVEVWVTAHGGVVAWQTSNPADPTAMWPMFAFGFGFCFCVTQVFGIAWWYRHPPWLRGAPLVAYTALAVAFFVGKPAYRVNEIVRIPGVYVLFVLFTYGFASAILRLAAALAARCHSVAPKLPPDTHGVAPTASPTHAPDLPAPDHPATADNPKLTAEPLSFAQALRFLLRPRSVLAACLFGVVYFVFTVVSVMAEVNDWLWSSLLLMVFFIFLFMVGQTATFLPVRMLFDARCRVPAF